MTPVYVITSEKYHWALRPFCYLFNIYWSTLQQVTVVTDAPIKIDLPPNFTQKSISEGQPLPQENWSNGIIYMLNHMPSSHFVLLLEDYWLVRTVDHQGIKTLHELAIKHPDILRIDLTDDRQYSGQMKDAGYYGHYDLVETPGESPYQMSLQAGIWSRDLLLSIIKPNMSPWQVELEISPDLHNRDDIRVIGTRQRLIRYVNVFKGGDSEKALNLEGLPKEHLNELRRRGWLA